MNQFFRETMPLSIIKERNGGKILHFDVQITNLDTLHRAHVYRDHIDLRMQRRVEQ